MPFAPLTTEDDILERARDAVSTVRDGQSETREEMRANLAFAKNDMWPAASKKQRLEDKRPMYVFNIVDRLVDAVVGGARQNDIGIEFVPVAQGDRFNAWLKEGIARNIQYLSESKRAFLWAIECASRLGEGYFRLRVDYENERSMNPCLRFETVFDPLMGGMDPRANDPTGEDADWAFTLEKYGKDDFLALFGEEAVPRDAAIESELLQDWYDATSGDAEKIKRYLVMDFMWKEHARKWIGEGADGYVIELEGQPVSGDGEPTDGSGPCWGIYQGEWVLLGRARQVETHRIREAFVCGHRVLKGPWDWHGSHLPLYRVPGKQIIGDGVRIVKGVYSNVRDTNRVLNNMFTVSVEMANANLKGKWVTPWKSIKGHWDRFWSKSGNPSVNVLPYDPDLMAPNAGKPVWESPPVQLQGQFSLGQQAVGLVRYVSGIGEDISGLQNNASSGRQELIRVQQSGLSAAVYEENLEAAVEAASRELARLIPIYYRGTRTVQVILEEAGGEPMALPLGQFPEQQTIEALAKIAERRGIPLPQIIEALDLKHSDERVRVKVSKSWLTRRMEAQEFIREALQYIPPEFLGDIMDLLFEYADVPGAYQIANRLKEARQERTAKVEMDSAASAALQSLLQNPQLAKALRSLTQQTVQEYVSGRQKQPPQPQQPPQQEFLPAPEEAFAMMGE